jgi:putative transposase
VLLKILHNVREKYHFSLVGYVVMPEHIHILISEPKIGTPGTVMQVFKQRVSRALRMKTRPRNANQLSLWKNAPHLHAKHFWQRRFYDFNVWSARKRIEKLHYMHRNPVKRGLVNDPKLWLWSSYRFYQYDENNICTPDREPRYGIEEAKAKSTSQHTHPSQNEGCAAQKPKA